MTPNGTTPCTIVNGRFNVCSTDPYALTVLAAVLVAGLVAAEVRAR